MCWPVYACVWAGGRERRQSRGRPHGGFSWCQFPLHSVAFRERGGVGSSPRNHEERRRVDTSKACASRRICPFVLYSGTAVVYLSCAMARDDLSGQSRCVLLVLLRTVELLACESGVCTCRSAWISSGQLRAVSRQPCGDHCCAHPTGATRVGFSGGRTTQLASSHARRSLALRRPTSRALMSHPLKSTDISSWDGIWLSSA